MGWAQITNLQAALTEGQEIRITVQAGTFLQASDYVGDIKNWMQESGQFQVESVKDVTPYFTVFGSRWEITGLILASLTGAELIAMTQNKLNSWTTWNVAVLTLETGGALPNLPSYKNVLITLGLVAAIIIGGVFLIREVK